MGTSMEEFKKLSNMEKWKFIMRVPPFHDNTFVGKQTSDALVGRVRVVGIIQCNFVFVSNCSAIE